MSLKYLVLIALLTEQIYADFRVIGGDDADIVDYPYQVGITARKSAGKYSFCGGSILSSKFILSAAHCFITRKASRLIIRTGSSYRGRQGVVSKVKSVNVHPSFNPHTFDYDVAILELTAPLTFSTKTRPVQLASNVTCLYDNASAVVTGWGRTSCNGLLAQRLQVATIPLLTTDSCRKVYAAHRISDRMICAGTPDKDSWKGDSGGPLVVSGVQVGIVSSKRGCGEGSFPGTFTIVSEVMDYITETIKG